MKAVIISGTVGVGKTTVASEIADALGERDYPVAVIDVDNLCQAEPPPADDPYNQRLAFANLAAIIPNYQALGIEYFALARVIEDPADRAVYDSLFGGRVPVVRLEADVDERRARLIAREPDGRWRDWHLNRTEELATVLRELACEDHVVVNDGRPPRETANEVIALLGW